MSGNNGFRGFGNDQPGSFPDYNNGITISKDVVYQAVSDGFLNVVFSGSYQNFLTIQVGSTSNPATVIAQSGNDQNNYSYAGSFMVPIKKGTYYKVTKNGVPYWSGLGDYESISSIFYPCG